VGAAVVQFYWGSLQGEPDLFSLQAPVQKLSDANERDSLNPTGRSHPQLPSTQRAVLSRR
jgi:hypothetical protein